MAAQKQERIIRVGDVIHVGQGDPGLPQAVVDRMERQLPRRERHRPLGVLAVREPLFLRGRDDDAVTDQAGGRIVIGGVDSRGCTSLFLLMNFKGSALGTPRLRATPSAAVGGERSEFASCT